MLLALLPLTRLISLGSLSFVAFLAWTSIHSFLDKYTSMGGQIEKLSHTNELLNSRLASYNLRIQRRRASLA